MTQPLQADAQREGYESWLAVRQQQVWRQGQAPLREAYDAGWEAALRSQEELIACLRKMLKALQSVTYFPESNIGTDWKPLFREAKAACAEAERLIGEL